MGHTSENDSIAGFAAAGSMPRSHNPGTAGKICAFQWPARLLPVYWPATAEPLLIVVLNLLPGVNPHGAPLPALPQLRQFGMWQDGDLVVPHVPGASVRRGGSGLKLHVGGENWGSCSAGAGTQWSITTSCLVGVASGIGHLRGQPAAGAFTEKLYQQQAVICAATVSGPPFAVHISQLGIRKTQR